MTTKVNIRDILGEKKKFRDKAGHKCKTRGICAPYPDFTFSLSRYYDLTHFPFAKCHKNKMGLFSFDSFFFWMIIQFLFMQVI